MKCAKCGAELKLDCLYCSVCGQEAQIVSDSNLLEEELLRELLKEEEKKQPSLEKEPDQKKTVSSKKAVSSKKKKKSHKPLIILLSCLAVLIIAGVIFVQVIRNKNQNSFDYQITKAKEYVAEKNYVKALNFFDRALELKEDDVETRLQMVEIFLSMEEEKKAISMLHEIISIDPLSTEAYEKLIDLYEESEDYEAILKLKADITDDALLELFSSYEVLPPAFRQEPGEYAEYISIELVAEKNCNIYYTLDGSDPVAGGQLYTEPLKLEEQGELEITAVACNNYGIYSEVLEGTFTVKFQKPKMAAAFPDGGSFTEPTTIELIGSEGCHMYYTWDGTDPTAASTEYTAPIEVPEGDNILSVLLVDKYGMVSDVLKCNYKYFP